MSLVVESASPRPGRPPQISREAVLEAGLELAESEGVEALSIRRLATALGVTPRALYRHVRNKEDILVAVIDRVVSHARVTDHAVPRSRWKDWLRATFGAMHRTLIEQPGVIPVLRYSLQLGPQAVAVVDDVMDVLQSAGLDRAAASKGLLALMGYTVGVAALRSTEPATDLDEATTHDPFNDGFDVVLAGLGSQ
jgi:AcrR family transcriptional regulator